MCPLEVLTTAGANGRHAETAMSSAKREADAAAVTPDPSRPRVVLAIFGDSVSDTGNTFRAGGVPQADVYYQGRYSNGPMWVDYLSEAVANTTHLTVLNYAYGGAAACPENGVSGQYPFILDLPQQTDAFFADVSAPQDQNHDPDDLDSEDDLAGGGCATRRLVPVNFIGNNDVRGVLLTALGAGAFPDAAAIKALVESATACRIAWARRLLEAGEAVWRGQSGPEQVLVFLPVARIDLSPSVPAELFPIVNSFIRLAV